MSTTKTTTDRMAEFEWVNQLPHDAHRVHDGHLGVEERQEFVRRLEAHWDAAIPQAVWDHWSLGRFPTTQASVTHPEEGGWSHLCVFPFPRTADVSRVRLYVQTARGCRLWATQYYVVRVATFPLLGELILAMDLLALADDLSS